MTESHLEKSPNTHHVKSASIGSYPVRRMRNTAVLVKWIEEHQSNPYPTKAEKQYLAYYSGMNLTQLSTWFANARRRIKKIGMKTWLEGRSTFTVDLFPASAPMPQRPAMATDYTGAASHYGSPYAAYSPSAALLQAGSYQAQQASAIGHQSAATRLLSNGLSYGSDSSSSLQHNAGSTALNGLYSGHARTSQPGMMMMGFSNWPTMSASSSLLPSTSTSALYRNSTIPGLQSPLAAYSADAAAHAQIRTHSGAAMEVSDGSYSMPQHSPDQMLPECASAEPMLQDTGSQKSSITS